MPKLKAYPRTEIIAPDGPDDLVEPPAWESDGRVVMPPQRPSTAFVQRDAYQDLKRQAREEAAQRAPQAPPVQRQAVASAEPPREAKKKGRMLLIAGAVLAFVVLPLLPVALGVIGGVAFWLLYPMSG